MRGRKQQKAYLEALRQADFAASLQRATAYQLSFKLAAVEAAYQTRIDEEGCSPIYTALKHRIWDTLDLIERTPLHPHGAGVAKR